MIVDGATRVVRRRRRRAVALPSPVTTMLIAYGLADGRICGALSNGMGGWDTWQCVDALGTASDSYTFVDAFPVGVTGDGALLAMQDPGAVYGVMAAPTGEFVQLPEAWPGVTTDYWSLMNFAADNEGKMWAVFLTQPEFANGGATPARVTRDGVIKYRTVGAGHAGFQYLPLRDVVAVYGAGTLDFFDPALFIPWD